MTPESTATTTTRGPSTPEPPAPTTTGSRTTRILGLLALGATVLLVLFGFWWTPPDVVQDESVRILYVHVPSATLAYVGCFLTSLGSVMYLWKKSQWWELVGYAAAEIAAVFTAITLVTGMLWGRPTWGVFWVWDARLTSTAMLFLLLLGYLAIRRLPARLRRAGQAGLRRRSPPRPQRDHRAPVRAVVAHPAPGSQPLRRRSGSHHRGDHAVRPLLRVRDLRARSSPG